MSARISKLSNGMRVVSHCMPELETASLGVWVATGARHEGLSEHGISHLLEHMAFKGTERRDALAIAEEIEQVGGELNAATSLEYTAFYARVLKGDVGLALEILADILLNSAFDADELEREREVILQEIAASLDSPDDMVYDLAQEAAFPGQALGRSILGTPDSVGCFQAADLRGFLQERYGARQMVVSGAGAINHDSFVRHVEALFGGLAEGSGLETPKARFEGGARASEKPFEQSHIVIGYEGASYLSDDHYCAQVFSGLLGGGMSSRLFQEVREKRGLCYAIYASAWGLSDSGMFNVHAATGAELMGDLCDVINEQMLRVRDEGPSTREVSRAKAQLKAGLMISMENSMARAEQMARQLSAHGRIISADELMQKVDAVTRDDVQAFAARLVASTPAVAVVGAGEHSIEHARHAGRLAAA